MEQPSEAQDWKQLSAVDRVRFGEAIAPDVAVDRISRRITVATTCIVCGHAFWQSLNDDDLIFEPGLRSDQSHRQSSRTIEFIVACTCAVEHPGRPQGLDAGCGAACRLKDTPDGC